MSAKPFIRKGEFHWYCFGPRMVTGIGGTPRAAYFHWLLRGGSTS